MEFPAREAADTGAVPASGGPRDRAPWGPLPEIGSGREACEGGVTMQQTSTLAAQTIDYLGGLKVTQGAGIGGPLVVFPWQRRFVRGALRPGVEESALSVSRGAGKTTLTAGIAAAALDGPLAAPRGETVVIASSFDQARIGFEHALAFLEDRISEDRNRWRIQDSANRATIEDRKTGARVRVLGSDPRRAHGLAPVLVVCDEPSQWPESTTERMIAALRTSMGKIDGSRLIALGTRPADSGHWFAKMLAGGADYSQTHAARPHDEPFHARTWTRANPSLPYMPALMRTIRKEAARARLDPNILPSFRALRLNQGTSDVLRASLLSAGLWESIEGEALTVGPSVWGVDLGATAAMSAVVGYWPDTGRLDFVAAFPEQPSLAERGLLDGVGRLYLDMVDRGELIQTGGRVVDVETLLREAMGRFGPPDAVAADRWREGELRDGLDVAGIPSAAFVTRGQGFKDGGEDVRAFRRMCLTGRVIPVQSLLMRAAMRESVTVSDMAGNEKLAKSSEGGRRARGRDDAAAAAILAVAVGSRSPEREETVSDGLAFVG